MDDYERMIKEAKARLLAAERKARKERLKSPQFLTFAAMSAVFFAAVWWFCSEPQVQNTTMAQFFLAWGFMITSLVWSLFAIVVPEHNARMFKKRT